MPRVLPPGAITIPSTATRVFNGVLFDVYQWPQKLFDGREVTFEMLRRPDTVQVIVVKGDQIVMLHETQPGREPMLKFPGGRVDEGEEWLAAAQREVREETGLVLANWKLVAVQQPVAKIEWFVAIFVAAGVTAEEPQEYDGGEKITLVPMAFDQAKRALSTSPNAFNNAGTALLQNCASLNDLCALPTLEDTK